MRKEWGKTKNGAAMKTTLSMGNGNGNGERGEWATGGIQTVSARKLHTKSNDVQSYFSQVLCSRHKLQAITLTLPYPPVQLTPAHTCLIPSLSPAPSFLLRQHELQLLLLSPPYGAMWPCGCVDLG